VPVLRVSAPDGTIRAVLFGYACHNTTLAFYQWCGDYAGYAQADVEAAHPGAIALFVQGCGGDQNPYPRGKIELAQMHGQSLATAVEAALTATAQPVSGPLQEKLADVQIDFAPLTRTDLEEQAKSSNKWMANHAKGVLAQLERGEKPATHYPYPVQVLRFGDGLTFVGLAGETVVDYSLRLKHELAGPPLWIAGYCNDVMAYIPSKRVLEEGGYEARDSMYFSKLPGPWAPTLEERIVGEVHTLLGGLATQ
jgi:neutral ceramidase